MNAIAVGERGATYLFVMFAIVLMGLTFTAAAQQWKTVVQREQEAELLFRGLAIETAISAYTAAQVKGRVMPTTPFPPTLEELTRPPKPFLRQVYKDPLTGQDWEYLRDPTGGIMGVRSRSKATPIKQSNFPPAVEHFAGAKSYDAWVFKAQMPSVPPNSQTPEGDSTDGSSAGKSPNISAPKAPQPENPTPAATP